MSISSKLTDIRTAISSAYTAVSNMGGTVPALPTLNALPSAIQTIGGSDSKFKDLVARTITSLEDSTVTTIGSYAFNSCSRLTTANFPKCTSIGYNAFYSCSRLTTIYIGTSNCVLGNSTAFSYTGIWSTKGSIYVPSAYVESYKTKTHWTYFSDRIFGY